MPHGSRDVFPFSQQHCFRHLQSLYRGQAVNPKLNQGCNANAGAAAAAELCCCHLETFCVNRNEKHSLRTLTMRNALLLMASLPLGSMAIASGKRATTQGPSEQFATAEAMRVIPKWAPITNTTFKSIDIRASSLYQCTITYSP